jgi:hypothetical protein
VTVPDATKSRPVLTFGKYRIILGPKIGWAAALAVLIVVVGIAVTPSNPWAGFGVAVGGIAGAVLGTLLQAAPIPPDYKAEAGSAARHLLSIADDIDAVRTVSNQLAAVSPNQRVKLGLVNVQDDLFKVRTAVYVAIAEWDAIAPGLVDEIEQFKTAGSLALAKLTREESIE